ncbi:hypothetical protein [uncultured Thiodictyon sp.]|uniref:hypothetical protein n=1 Tax=uncultured Thiodictyon sp. TaxID=1846217 RepID=UPI0025E34DB0|nr:hypothetical protein [uncultured Thiodictyon sp.]
MQLAFAIDHYTMLVRKITGKDMKDDEFMEIAAALMSNSESALSALNISQVFCDARFRGSLLNNFLMRLRKGIEGDHRFAYTENIPDRLKPFQSNETNLIRWCQRGNKSDGWECKGIFFAAPTTLSPADGQAAVP